MFFSATNKRWHGREEALELDLIRRRYVLRRRERSSMSHRRQFKGKLITLNSDLLSLCKRHFSASAPGQQMVLPEAVSHSV